MMLGALSGVNEHSWRSLVEKNEVFFVTMLLVLALPLFYPLLCVSLVLRCSSCGILIE